MSTIHFNCPECGSMIAFDSKHVGKSARCVKCGLHFLIPGKSNEKPFILRPPAEKAEPLPGFYKAFLVDSWKLFLSPENWLMLLVIFFLVVFKYFLGNAICCMNFISLFLIWGWLFGYYMLIIDHTGFGADHLPEFYFGTSITFFLEALKPIATFAYTFFLVEFPFFIAFYIFLHAGLIEEEFWHSYGVWENILRLLILFGLFVFPMAVLTISIGRDITLILPHHLSYPIIKKPGPYLLIFIFMSLTVFIKRHTGSFDINNIGSYAQISGEIALNLLVQVLAIVTMRGIGLFYRHFCCYLKW